jgi:uncharacterized RmlC-like cupin family protein
MDVESNTVAAYAKIVRAGDSHVAAQGSVYRHGVSAETVGAAAIWLGEVTLPAGARTSAHRHDGHETAMLMTGGREIELWSGVGLAHRDHMRPGDYVFVPAGVPHVAVNRSAEPATFLGARNDPAANESVVLMPELDAVVPD